MPHKKLPVTFGRPGDANFDRAMEIMGKMLGAAAWDQKSDDLDPAEHTMITITALAFAAGYLTGACLIAGSLQEGDKKRAADAMLITYRQGIKTGRLNAMASMPTEGSA